MPIVSNEILRPSTSSVPPPKNYQNSNSKKSDTDPDVIENLISINNDHAELFFQTHDDSDMETKKNLFSYLVDLFSWNKKNITQETNELNIVLAEGQALQRDAESMMEQLQQTDEIYPPPFSLKSKTGWLMGAALLFGITGVRFYMQKHTKQESNRNFMPDYPVDDDKAQSEFETKKIGTEHFQYIGRRKNKHSRRSHSDELKKETHDIINRRLQTICFTNNTLDIAPVFENSINTKNNSCLQTFKLPNRLIPYVYTDDQPTQCKSDVFPKQCQRMHDIMPINNTELFLKLSINIDGIKCLCPPPNNLTVMIIPPLFEMEFLSPKITDENYKKHIEEIQSIEKIKKQQIENKKRIDTDDGIIDNDYLSERDFISEAQAVSMVNARNINSNLNNNMTIKFPRERIEGFLRGHSYLKIDAENKYLSRSILSLIANDLSFEAELARICLYGTGLYGEKKGDVIGEDLQHQLVGDLLSKLLYGLSVDDYLLHAFSQQRHVSIEKFISGVMQDNAPFDDDEMISEMAFFHERYGSHILLSTFSLGLYSSISVGSITWVLLYLSAGIKHRHHLNEENEYITNGIEIITSFIEGNLSQGSKEKIHLGLKFFAIYSEGILEPEVLNDFILLWRKFTGALIKRIGLSSDMVLQIKSIRDKLTKIDGIPWHSQFGVATQLMHQHCGPGLPLAFHKTNDYFQFVTRNDYINITGNKTWCVVYDHSKTDGFVSQLPIFKDYYDGLLSDGLKLFDEANRYLLQNLFYPGDFFNVDLEIDDISFINKSALEVVFMRVVEPRYIQEQRIGPVLNKIKLNRRYIFFRATFQSIQRFYMIDTEYQSFLRRIKVDTTNLKKDIGVYFDGWSLFPDEKLKLVVYKDKDVNVTISEFESTDVFINKIVSYQCEYLRNSIRMFNREFMTVEEKALEIMKDIFIPFYSCITELEKRESSSNIFINCFMDLTLVFVPMFGKSLNTAIRLSDVAVDLSFKVTASQVFKKEGTILWEKILMDPYIYNVVLNEQFILKKSVAGMLLGGVDPGIGTFVELKEIIEYFASVALKGEVIKLPFTMLHNFKVITEFGVQTKNIIDSSRKIFVKASKPSGRLTDVGHDDSRGGYSGIFDVIYSGNDYYAVFSDENNVSVLLGITSEMTKDGENIYITLDDEEFKGFFLNINW